MTPSAKILMASARRNSGSIAHFARNWVALSISAAAGSCRFFQMERTAHPHVQPVRVVQALVDLHGVIVDGRVLHRGDADRAHGIQRLVELRRLMVEARLRASRLRDLRGGVAQCARRLARGVALDVPARRILGRRRDIGEFQCDELAQTVCPSDPREQQRPVGDMESRSAKVSVSAGRIDHDGLEPPRCARRAAP